MPTARARTGLGLAPAALAVALAWAFAPGRAEAGGCHAPERPALAFASDLGRPDPPLASSPARVSTRLSPLPCKGETPSPVTRVVFATPVALGVSAPETAATPTGEPLLPPEPGAAPVPPAVRLDRPPRP